MSPTAPGSAPSAARPPAREALRRREPPTSRKPRLPERARAAGAAAGGGGRRTGTRGRGSGATRQQQRRQQPPQRKTRQEPAGTRTVAGSPKRVSPALIWGGFGVAAVIVILVVVLVTNGGGGPTDTPVATGSQSVQPVSADTSGSYGALVERANGLYDQGAAAFDAKQYDQGAAYFEAAAKVYAAAWKQQSTDPGVGTDYATSLFYSAQIGPALTQIEKVLAQSPEFQTAWFNKGNYLAEKARQADEDGDAKTAKAALRGRSRRLPEGGQSGRGLGLGPAGPAAPGRAAPVGRRPAGARRCRGLRRRPPTPPASRSMLGA